jgi:hypothetical protein
VEKLTEEQIAGLSKTETETVNLIRRTKRIQWLGLALSAIVAAVLYTEITTATEVTFFAVVGTVVATFYVVTPLLDFGIFQQEREKLEAHLEELENADGI